MHLRTIRLVCAGLIGLAGSISEARAEFSGIECLKSASFLAPLDSSDHRKYAPEREVDMLHLALDVTPDFRQRTVTGQATLRFKPLIKPVRQLTLDAVNLAVSSVSSTERIQGYHVTDEKIVITFAEAIATNREATVTIAYRAEPTMGLYFRTPEMGYKEGDTHLFTQGEAIEARHWYPCFDAPNEKFTSEVICRVPEGMTVLSNGRLISGGRDSTSGLVAVHWSQDKPHVNYLVSLVAGYFSKIEDKHGDLPLAFYVPPSQASEAANSFRETKDMMRFFEQEIGVPYPWVKYYQVCVNDFVAGGMENTSLTTLTDGTLFRLETENLRSSEGLVAHELAHQWFGDLVTCKDWSHLWLNEGFATYYDSLYAGFKHGRDAMLYDLYLSARQITGVANDTNPIVRRTYEGPMDMFNYLAYPKGGWVLHMLRSQLGEDLYRRCIKTYLQKHEYGVVATEDLRAVIEQLSGNSYDQFFDQWLYHAHHPEIEASYSWDESTRLARVSVKQVQKLSSEVLLFNFPLTIRFKGKSGSVDRHVQIKQREEDFYFPLESAPEIVRLDPEYMLLAKVTFRLPNAMLHAQLADASDVIGRLAAVEQMGEKKDKGTVAKLKEALNNDAFYGVRVEASRALRSIYTDDALDALLASTRQSDARVRRQVISDIGDFYRDSAYEAARKTLDAEKNPVIISEALASLGGYAKPEVRELLLKFLASTSYRNELASAAIGAMRSQDDPAYIAPLHEALSRREAEFTTSGFSQALGTLAYLARNEENKDEVREFLVRHLENRKRNVQRTAINALRTLGDPKAIGVLEKLATAAKDNPERAAAERALTDLRAGRKPVDDFKNLRQEVLDLQKANRDLRKELDDLKRKIEAQATATPPPTRKPAPARSPKGR